MTENAPGPEIVVGVDDSPASSPALRWAAAEAALWESPLTIVYAAAPTVATWSAIPMPTGLLEWQRSIGEQVLAEAEQVAKDVTHGSVPVRTEFRTGSPAATLVDRTRQARMVVVGSRGHGALARAALGSVSTGVVHRAHCPVAVIHDEEVTTPATTAPVVLGFDGSPASDGATTLAFQEAQRRGVELVAVHAWWSAGAFDFPGIVWEDLLSEVDREVAARLAGWQQRFPDVTVKRVVEPDLPAHRLINHARYAQLIVVGSHGHGGVASTLLGSVSTAIVQAARTPVIVVRPQ
ncbi:universal stress protein [Mycobacterium sp. GA-2829]|uniref:universal stress protein n=1 Tax=Mycobacterium sp. GA-2829 TaxID=1772283 RepID=UPI000740291A|nr:universal stress protein [Mycobacterium sp. GA-2829]KUI32627.1 universal stress protein [Mycobacterium sp. GA-2829]